MSNSDKQLKENSYTVLMQTLSRIVNYKTFFHFQSHFA